MSKIEITSAVVTVRWRCTVCGRKFEGSYQYPTVAEARERVEGEECYLCECAARPHVPSEGIPTYKAQKIVAYASLNDLRQLAKKALATVTYDGDYRATAAAGRRLQTGLLELVCSSGAHT